MKDRRRGLIIPGRLSISSITCLEGLDLTLQDLSPRQERRPLDLEVSRQKPERPGCLLVGAKVGPCGDLRHMSRRDIRPRRPTTEHLFPFPLRCARWRAIASGHVTTGLPYRAIIPRTYFYTPRSDMTCNFFGFWPLQRSSNGTCQMVSRSALMQSSMVSQQPHPLLVSCSTGFRSHRNGGHGQHQRPSEWCLCPTVVLREGRVELHDRKCLKLVGSATNRGWVRQREMSRSRRQRLGEEDFFFFFF